ncbi:MAG: phosphoadenylyl-sulfate reductase [Geminicoccaceae bacterium]
MSGMIDYLADLKAAYGHLDGLALLRPLLREGPLKGQTALVSSFGAESIVLLDMIATVDPWTPVIFLDSGKLFAETQGYREDVVALLALKDVRITGPAPDQLARYDSASDLWRREPDLCCDLRKAQPLIGVLEGFAAWITGRKRFQGGARVTLPVIEGEPSTGRIKLNPLARWTAEDIERYRFLRNLPAHPLVERGYRSIGCAPCTRPVASGQAPRAGRWWGVDKTECGIHGQ